jgi:hypothetical protein
MAATETASTSSKLQHLAPRPDEQDFATKVNLRLGNEAKVNAYRIHEDNEIRHGMVFQWGTVRKTLERDVPFSHVGEEELAAKVMEWVQHLKAGQRWDGEVELL